MTRRYKAQEQEGFEAYHEKYRSMKVNSPILNNNMENASLMGTNNVGNIPSMLNKYIGDEKGFVNDDKGDTLAYIPFLNERLKKIKKEYKEINTQLLNQGRPPLKEMPLNLNHEKLETEARIDIYQEEVDKLNLMQKDKEEAKSKVNNAKCLRYGCSGISSLKGGILAEIDGQTVQLMTKGENKGLLIIDDTNSPYNGMLVQDYRESVQKPWMKTTDELRNRKHKYLQVLQYQGVEGDLDKLWFQEAAKIVKENKWEHIFEIKDSRKPAVPCWPVGVKKYSDN